MRACGVPDSKGLVLMMPQPAVRGRSPPAFPEGQYAAIWGDELWVVRLSQQTLLDCTCQHTHQIVTLHARSPFSCRSHLIAAAILP